MLIFTWYNCNTLKYGIDAVLIGQRLFFFAFYDMPRFWLHFVTICTKLGVLKRPLDSHFCRAAAGQVLSATMSKPALPILALSTIIGRCTMCLDAVIDGNIGRRTYTKHARASLG